jgi:hypothetical protein
MTMCMSGHAYKLEVVLHFLRAQGLELVPLWSQAPIGTQMSAFTTGSVVPNMLPNTLRLLTLCTAFIFPYKVEQVGRESETLGDNRP